MPNCSRQRLLKVLSDMRQGYGIEHKCFHGLTQLYCELYGGIDSNKRSFESFICNLKFVETLDFDAGYHPDLPDDIWNVKTLRHVKLQPYASRPSSSADLRNLQTLTGVRSKRSWNAHLPKIPNVRNLDIKVKKSLSWDSFATLLGTLNHLTCLSLYGHGDLPQKIVDMQGFPFYQHLESLSLRQEWKKPTFSRLSLSPEVGMFSIHVTVLILENFQFQDDPLPVLEKLRSLRMLRLFEEQANRKMNCSAGSFQQLRQLEFENLRLEEWEIEAGSMPILEDITLRYCPNLKVPLGLRYLSNLKELKISMCETFEKAEHANEIRDMCKHVPSIYINEYPYNT